MTCTCPEYPKVCSHECPDHQQVDDTGKDQCWAIIANNNGQGCVLAYGGGATLRYEIEEAGCHALDYLGLDDAPEGISVWEGRYNTTGNAGSPGYFDDSVETQPCGRFRALSNQEWGRLVKSNHEKIQHTKRKKP